MSMRLIHNNTYAIDQCCLSCSSHVVFLVWQTHCWHHMVVPAMDRGCRWSVGALHLLLPLALPSSIWGHGRAPMGALRVKVRTCMHYPWVCMLALACTSIVLAAIQYLLYIIYYILYILYNNIIRILIKISMMILMMILYIMMILIWWCN